MLAQHLLRQPAPIFAPIAAVVCLTDDPGKRGRRALRLLAGVCVGVAVGELATRVTGSGWLQVGTAVAAGMLVVALGSINSLTLLQAGIAALLVVGLASPATGWTRLLSAVIGGVLALVVSQVLVSPSPVRLLVGAAREALRGPAEALGEVAAALREGSAARAEDAVTALRGGQAPLATFLDTSETAGSLASTTVRGRRERARVAVLRRRLAGVEYVHASTVLLARTAVEVRAAGASVPAHLADGVDELAAAVRAVAADPGAPDPRADDLGGPRPTHEIADELAATRPGGLADRDAQLAAQLHVLARDVAALVDHSGTRATT
ncbi:aromatic acid exporter family protein [Actinomycetospora rhizophila]|uniref:Aromatic acid exporter family protein n=1 Tax=Actinomycetospora rhizophila TaxID=1416876 RepID=A0ABV9ZB16_9PSEU